ncbi:hypothetical protein EV383_0312 [Pseudonocardia sediminis]|uniref:Uncharacterized protein n=1 Tax=Pseudonocardia sediminis TaxID=1397368 RepID=A0A4Q7UP52_PSEST|nr:hypothetical protein [Pseudonocardia sediminis]RZT83507.1 hypothetical protein EV383_0312 [Pseudonocardia sediminis]
MDREHAGPATTGPRPGVSPGTAVLLWILVGWPLSWILLLFVFAPLGILFGIGITIWMMVTVSSAGARRGPPVLPGDRYGPPPSPAETRYQAIRREVESIATVNAVGGCGWCGSPSAHVNDLGYLVPPHHWHSAEIEERIRYKLER